MNIPLFLKYLTEYQRKSYADKMSRKYKRKRKIDSIKERVISFRSNGESVCKVHTAYIYTLENSAFNGWYKIGTCVDLTKRLQTYQTSDPMKGYRFVDTWIVRNRFDVEQEFLSYATRSSLFEVKGEWVYSIDYSKLRGKLDGFCINKSTLKRSKKISQGIKENQVG